MSTTNNRPSVVGGYFLKAVSKYGMSSTILYCNCYFLRGDLILGCPRIVRSDRGTENCKIAYLQPFLRRAGQDELSGERSFQYGKSSSNQVSVFCVRVCV